MSIGFVDPLGVLFSGSDEVLSHLPWKSRHHAVFNEQSGSRFTLLRLLVRVFRCESFSARPTGDTYISPELCEMAIPCVVTMIGQTGAIMRFTKSVRL